MSSCLEVAVLGEQTPRSRFELAQGAFMWPPLDVERPSSRLAELPPHGADLAPHLKCVAPWSLRAQACCVAAWLPP